MVKWIGVLSVEIIADGGKLLKFPFFKLQWAFYKRATIGEIHVPLLDTIPSQFPQTHTFSPNSLKTHTDIKFSFPNRTPRPHPLAFPNS